MSDLNLKPLAFVPQLDDQTKAYCRGPITPASPNGAREGRFPYFHKGFVDLNIPRDSAYTEDIHAATVEGKFAVADEHGRLVAENIANLVALDKAIAGARIKLDVEVQVPVEEQVPVEA